MVVSAHPLASRVGMTILEQGGNAADAALATMAALNVVEPQASGLGGGGFLLYYDAARDSFYVLDYRERAPARLKLSDYFQKPDTLHLVQRMGGEAIGTPGAPAGWQALHDRFGTKLLSEIFAPAILLADSGYPVSEKQAAVILDDLEQLQSDSMLARTFLVDSLPPTAGYILRQPKLAALMKFLSRTRLDNLYYPPTSNGLLHTLASRGSMIRQDDLLGYRVKDRKPVRGYYHGYEIITLPPPSSGGTALLEILKLVEPYDLKSMGYMSPEYVHTVALATRQAFTDVDHWVSDPDFDKVPSDAILSDEWITAARTHLVADSVPSRMTALDSALAFKNGNTTHLVVVDSAGNVVSLTQSINYFFGAGVMVPELGLLLNNHMADFTFDSTGADALAPLHRPRSNMAATIVRKDGRPILVIGSPGGQRIPAVLAQVLIDILDFQMPLADALNAPRFCPVRQMLVVETRISESTLNALHAKGWKIQPFGSANSYFGGVHAIQIDASSGNLVGAADPRRDGAPAGY
jgi:gamma-glutamyltranspeptidase/glutathione hydrolase